MGYQLSLEGSLVMAVRYDPPGEFTRKSSNGMKRWMARQLERDKHPIFISHLNFTTWLRLLKNKTIEVDSL